MHVQHARSVLRSPLPGSRQAARLEELRRIPTSDSKLSRRCVLREIRGPQASPTGDSGLRTFDSLALDFPPSARPGQTHSHLSPNPASHLPPSPSSRRRLARPRIALVFTPSRRGSPGLAQSEWTLVSGQARRAREHRIGRSGRCGTQRWPGVLASPNEVLLLDCAATLKWRFETCRGADRAFLSTGLYSPSLPSAYLLERPFRIESPPTPLLHVLPFLVSWRGLQTSLNYGRELGSAGRQRGIARVRTVAATPHELL